MRTLDPGNLVPRKPVNKQEIKASITDAIARQVVGSNREEIALRVEETYERILRGAAISVHVPSLTAGAVRRAVMASMRGKDAQVRHPLEAKPNSD